MAIVLEASGLVKSFANVRAVDGVDLTIGDGDGSRCSGRTVRGRRPPC